MKKIIILEDLVVHWWFLFVGLQSITVEKSKRTQKRSVRFMKNDLEKKHNLKVSLGQCSIAKKEAFVEVEWTMKDHYKILWRYVEEIRMTILGA